MNPLMFKQYKQKKKRAVDPNAPPRPTLLGHDKTMREMQGLLASTDQKLIDKDQEIAQLKRKVSRLEQTVNQLIAVVKRL
jgi:hypothetical protein